MTVRELIEDLEELPQDAFVVADLQEVTKATYSANSYFLIKPDEYSSGPVVTLE